MGGISILPTYDLWTLSLSLPTPYSPARRQERKPADRLLRQMVGVGAKRTKTNNDGAQVFITSIDRVLPRQSQRYSRRLTLGKIPTHNKVLLRANPSFFISRYAPFREKPSINASLLDL
jgi:hypothetical protein